MEELNEKRVTDGLITYLRKELRDQSMQYRSPPTSLTGGFATHLFKFQLKDMSEEFSKPLVLRLYPKSYPAGQANLEGLIHNALSKAGYPAPPVYFICSDTTILGGEFLIMKFMSSEGMMDAFPIDIVPARLAKAHVVLHKIDPKPVVEYLTEKGFFSLKEKGYFLENLMSYIESTETQITANNLEWLKPGVQWIKENRPTENIRLVINHGDFHPNNILVDQGKISAVLDWSGFKVWEPEYDVAHTIIVWTCVGPSVFPNIDWNQFVNRYYECYLSEYPLNQARVEYYKAWRCIFFIFAFEGMGVEVFGRSGVQERLVQRFQEITGIELKRIS